jgi:hypothetical protein
MAHARSTDAPLLRLHMVLDQTLGHRDGNLVGALTATLGASPRSSAALSTGAHEATGSDVTSVVGSARESTSSTTLGSIEGC